MVHNFQVYTLIKFVITNNIENEYIEKCVKNYNKNNDCLQFFLNWTECLGLILVEYKTV